MYQRGHAAAAVAAVAVAVKIDYLYKKKTPQMLQVIPSLRSKPIADQVRLLGNLRNYVTNDAFVNFMANYDLNDRRGDPRMQIQIQAFEFTPGLKAQVVAWLSSGTGESI